MHKRKAPLNRPPGRLTRVVDVTVLDFSTRLGLSPREGIVLRYLALGYRYQEIGEVLEISARTVKLHVTNLRHKLGANSRADLLRRLFAA